MIVDLKQLVSEITDEQIIELVYSLGGTQHIEKNDYIIFQTICHNENPEDASMKLYYYRRNKAFHCYTECGENFNIIGLFERRYEILGIQYDFYADIVLKLMGGHSFTIEEGFNVAYKSETKRYQSNTIEVNISEIPEHILNVFTFSPTEEWIKEGISIAAMRTFNILHSPQQNKIIIPHYDENDRLIGIRGRALMEEDLKLGKYRPVSIEGKMYNHPLGYNLYGLNLNKENIKRRKFAVIFESEKSVLMFETIYGRDDNVAVAVCGSSISKYQIDLLRHFGAEKIIVAFDNVPRFEKIKQLEKMKKLCDKFKYIVKIGFIMDFQDLLGLKDSPIDLGKEKFEKLMKHIIWR